VIGVAAIDVGMAQARWIDCGALVARGFSRASAGFDAELT
jgi:hypothetical protein